jgi:streptomycin 6-kinase
MHIEIPENLRKNRIALHGADALAWLDALPGLIERTSEQWSLNVLPPFDGLSYNYVAPAVRANGMPVVLKISYPGLDFGHETAATRAFAGRMCARLLEVDDVASMTLIERVEPGEKLFVLEDDAAEVSIAATIMRGLRCPPPDDHEFPMASDWLNDALEPSTLPGRKQEMPWIDRALSHIAEIAQDGEPQLLLHGDLHHMNILSGRREPWLAIDPHGVVGDAAWEIAPFLINNLEHFPASDWPRVIRRRADQFAEELALDRRRVYAWSAVRCIQSAFWSLVDGKPPDGPEALVAGRVLTEAME